MRITCETPDHFYIGQTGQYFERMKKHLNGNGAQFVKRHGIVSHRPISYHDTPEAAKRAETSYYRKLTREGKRASVGH